MPTTVTRTVAPTGADYTSLALFEAGEQRDLVLADEIARVLCSEFVDTTAADFNGWTTSNTQKLQIDGEVPNKGQRDVGYRLSPSANSFFALAVRDGIAIDINDIAITNQSGSASPRGLDILAQSSALSANINRCLIHDVVDDGARVAAHTAVYNTTFNNCILVGVGNVGLRHSDTTNRDRCKANFCTVFGGASSGILGSKSVNCLSFDNTGNDFSLSDATSSNNISSDATAPGTGSLTNRNSADFFASLSAGFEDLHLKDGLTEADDAGVAVIDVTDDIDGHARGTPPDVGADEFVVGQGGGAGGQIYIPTWAPRRRS